MFRHNSQKTNVTPNIKFLMPQVVNFHFTKLIVESIKVDLSYPTSVSICLSLNSLSLIVAYFWEHM